MMTRPEIKIGHTDRDSYFWKMVTHNGTFIAGCTCLTSYEDAILGALKYACKNDITNQYTRPRGVAP